MDLSRLPRVPLAHLPTPLEPMEALARHLGAGPRLFVKRDDCTGLALGGNKTRKLEFTVGQALTEGADVLVTSGGVQSNHVRQTAAAAARLGMGFHGVLADPMAGADYGADRAYGDNGNHLLDRVLGGELHAVADDGEATELRIRELVDELRGAGHRPYVVPLGASDGVGSMGYVACAAELLTQCRDQGLEPSHVVLATGSAGTHGGLLAGLRALGSSIEVIGISVSEPAAAKREKVRAVIEQLAARWPGAPPVVPDGDVEVRDEFVGPGYGVPTAAGRRALELAARTEGLLLDPVYTAKALAGLLALVADGPLAGGRDVIFLHTGGAPALFAYPELVE